MSPVQFNKTIPGVGAPSTGQSQRVLRQAQNDLRQGQNGFAGALAGVLRQAQHDQQAPVKISAHAAKRLAQRGVEFSTDDQVRLGVAMDRIDSKGADKSLVLMDDLTLIVSARNRVVITSLDSASAKDGVFTNIDSAVII